MKSHPHRVGPMRGLLMFVVLAGLCLPGAATARLRPGDRAPDFVMFTLDGTRIPSSALRGQVVIVNLWATWCGPCRQEMPLLETYSRAHAAQGLRVFALATQDSAPESELRRIAAALSFPLIHSISSDRFRVLGGVPTNYVIDRQGIVRFAQAAAFDQDMLDDVVAPLLAEPVPPISPAPPTMTAMATPRP